MTPKLTFNRHQSLEEMAQKQRRLPILELKGGEGHYQCSIEGLGSGEGVWEVLRASCPLHLPNLDPLPKALHCVSC